MFKVVGRLLYFVLVEYITISDTTKFAIRPYQVIHTVHALDIHGKALKTVRDFSCHWETLNTTDLLEVSKLGNFHTIEPNFPTKPPSAKRW